MAGAKSTRVLVIDSSFLFYLGVSQALSTKRWQVVGWVQDLDCAMQRCTTDAIDLAIIGHSLSPRNALAICRALQQAFSQIKIILLCAFAANPLLQHDALCAGADACLPSSVNHDEFLATCTDVMKGRYARNVRLGNSALPQLTPREIEILKLVAQDYCDREIAQTLRISVNTARNHMQNILRKLEVSNREAAVWRAKHRGWI